MSGGDERDSKSSKSFDLLTRYLYIVSQAEHNREVVIELLEELNRIRSEWSHTLNRCHKLEKLLAMEQEGRRNLAEENRKLARELDRAKWMSGEDNTMTAARVRKRSIDFLVDENETPYKLRRSSSVIVSNSVDVNSSTPCARSGDAQDPFASPILESSKTRRSSLGADYLFPSDFVISRRHTFVSRRNLLSGLSCDHCKGQIRYCVLYFRCSACKLDYHEQCSRKVEMPCLPRRITPKVDTSNVKRLGDFCPNSPPRIPHLIVRCVMHMEKTVCDTQLYETFGDDNKAAKLLSDFKTQRDLPDLTSYDAQTIAGCVMMFLIQIREPLILWSSHKEFFVAQDQGGILDSINSLPTTHRDTLVYLLSHWKRLAEFGYNKGNTVESLCRVLGPIVFGTSRPTFSSNSADQTKPIEDSRIALQKMVELPFDVLKDLIQEETSSIGTPLSRNISDLRRNKPLIVLSAGKS